MILLLGLAILPFISAIWVDPLIPMISNIRPPKEFLGIAFALAIGLTALFRGIAPVKNKVLLFLVAYLVLVVWYVPPYPLTFGKTAISSFWVYKPVTYALVYFLMYLGVTNMAIDKLRVFKYIMWGGIITSVYIFLQRLGLD